MKLFAVKFRRILEVLCLQSLQKVLGAFSPFMCLKISHFLRSSNAFRKFSPCEIYKKVLGALSRFLRPQTKLFAVKFRRIAFLHASFVKKLWRIFSIFASKDEAVCLEVQTDF